MKFRHKCLTRVYGIMLIGMLICHSSGNAQSRLEVGYVYGISNFLGDLGGNAGKGGFFLKDNMMSLTRFITGFHAGYHPSEYINFDLSYVAGKLEGADSLIKGNGGVEVARKTRDQHFRSPLKELTLTLEIFPTVYFEYDPNNVAGKIKPYLLFGIGVFQFNPQAQYIKPDGTREWVDLKPLRTEGQGMSSHPDRKEYSLTQMNIPYGFGVKYHLSRTISISLEAITRKTFTDYIDDVHGVYYDKATLLALKGPIAVALADPSKGDIPTATMPNADGTGAQRGDKQLDSFMAIEFKLGYLIKSKKRKKTRAKF